MYIYIFFIYIYIYISKQNVRALKIIFSVVKNYTFSDFPGGAVVKNPPANAGDTGSSPGPGRSHMPRSN